jgi:hypothetical protein
MTVEERVRRSLEEGLGALGTGVGDIAGVVESGQRIRRRRRLAGALGVAVVVVLVAVAGGVRLGDGSARTPDPAPPVGGTWRALAPMPLSPRWMPLTVWTGEEALVVGGGIDPPCPPTASCVEADKMARDGAAYDPRTDTWRPIADAPVDAGYWFRTAVVGDTVVVYDGDQRWWAYDIGADVWRGLPAPDRRVVDTGTLAERDGAVYALSASGRVLALDVASRGWSELPPSPLDPALSRGSVLVTDDAVLVSGSEKVDDWNGDTPLFTIVERWDGTTWSRYPQTGQVGPFGHWTGERLIDLDIQVAPGLDGDPPFGGVLDPATGQWSPLPNAPDPDVRRPDGWMPVAADGPLVAGSGYVYDDRTERWTALGAPDSAVDDHQSAVWADGRLLVFGGIDTETGYEDVGGLSRDGWAWSPSS